MYYFRRTEDVNKHYTGSGTIDIPWLIGRGAAGNADKYDIELAIRNSHSGLLLPEPEFTVLPTSLTIRLANGGLGLVLE